MSLAAGASPEVVDGVVGVSFGEKKRNSLLAPNAIPSSSRKVMVTVQPIRIWRRVALEGFASSRVRSALDSEETDEPGVINRAASLATSVAAAGRPSGALASNRMISSESDRGNNGSTT